MIRDVSAVLVTRGDVDLSPILAELPFDDVVVWDNSVREDLSVYGRYAGIAAAKHRLIFVQDDDCVLTPVAVDMLLMKYRKGVLTANMPRPFRRRYPSLALVGFGAVFDRDLPEKAFARFREKWPDYDEQLLRRRADVVFAALTPHRFADVPYANLPHATADDRAYRQPGHTDERQRVLAAARSAR